MKASLFYKELKENGFGPFVGVPCSILKPFLEVLNEKQEEIIATSEGEAMGIASGLYLTGRNPVVFMQNSGLCNALNPLTSLNLIYKIPALLIITLRGEPGLKDAPEHKIMGEKTEGFLRLLDIEYKYLTNNIYFFKKNLRYLKRKLSKDLKPVALLLQHDILEKNSINKESLKSTNYELTRQAAIKEIAKSLKDSCFVITTTGKITREYYYCEDKPKNNFYMVGSMGCASAIGLGVTMGIEKDRKVAVIDGDGAVLMKMGNLATIGNVKPGNLIHIVLDNQCHASTGCQKTASVVTDLGRVAQNCGYSNVYKVTKFKEIQQIISEVMNIKGPTFILIKISNMNEENRNLGRPKESPEQVKKQFMKQIKAQ